MYGQKSISQSLLDAVNTAMFEEIHPQAQSLLKHIKPEHHSTYKPFLAKSVFNGSHKDKTDVLNAAKQAGHLVSENIEEIIEAWADMQKYVKDKAGPQPKGHIGQKAGTRYGGAGQKDDEREKETERLDKKKEMKKEDMDFKNRLIESLKGKQKNIDKNHNNKIDAQDFKILRAQKEEVELDEAGEIKTPSKGLTVDTLAGPKKAPKGFEKDNEHTSAKVPLKTEDLDEKYTAKELKMAGGIAKDKRYAGGNMTGASNVMDKIKPGLSQTKQAQKALRQANEEAEGHEDEKEDKALMKKMIKKSALKTEGKRPESDTVPFVTDEPQSPKERLRSALGKVKTEMKKSWC
jgi:hypothetical protein